MKIDRHDQAKILSPDDIKSLFEGSLKTARDRALFGVCLYTGVRIAEACSLHTKDVLFKDFSGNSSRNVGMSCRHAVLHQCVKASFSLGKRLLNFQQKERLAFIFLLGTMLSTGFSLT